MKLRSVLVSVLAASVAAGCASVATSPVVGRGELEGHILVEWIREDGFIYRQQKDKPFYFKPSFMNDRIIPEDMYTTGGSIPRMFWSIPGLSPWGLGPAYIIHDYIFEYHRCERTHVPHLNGITFDQSADILAEVARNLIEAGLIDHDLSGAVYAAVRSPIAEALWNRPGTAQECKRPPPAALTARRGGARPPVVFELTLPNRRS